MIIWEKSLPISFISFFKSRYLKKLFICFINFIITYDYSIPIHFLSLFFDMKVSFIQELDTILFFIENQKKWYSLPYQRLIRISKNLCRIFWVLVSEHGFELRFWKKALEKYYVLSFASLIIRRIFLILNQKFWYK